MTMTVYPDLTDPNFLTTHLASSWNASLLLFPASSPPRGMGGGQQHCVLFTTTQHYHTVTMNCGGWEGGRMCVHTHVDVCVCA